MTLAGAFKPAFPPHIPCGSRSPPQSSASSTGGSPCYDRRHPGIWRRNMQHSWRGIVMMVHVALGVCLSPHVCDSSSLTCIEVAQPILTEEAIIVSRVSYLLYRGPALAADEVAYTTKPNVVSVEGRKEPVNVNVADRLGLKVAMMPVPQPLDRLGEKLDTLKVVLDCSNLNTTALGKELIRPAVEATVECVLVNAAASRPPVACVRLEVSCSAFRDLAGTFDLQKLGGLPRRRVFQ